MSAETLHVISRFPGKWAVRRTGAVRVSRVFESQQAAITYARALAAKEHGELVIHKRDGMIQAVKSFGNDPTPPRATKR